MVELLPVLGQLGGGGAMVAIIIYLLAHIRADRIAAVERIDAAHRRADEAETRAREAWAREEIERRRAIEAEVALALARLPLPPPPPPDPTAPPAPIGGDGA